MFSPNASLPTLLLACDLGKSGGKFFYKRWNGPTQALWMDAEVAHRSRSVLGQVNPGGRSQDNAWYGSGDELTFVGKSARAHTDYNSFKEDKCLKAPERIVAALGAIAHAHQFPSEFEAIVWVLLPINELGTRKAMTARLTDLCQGFRFRDEQTFKISLRLSFRPEGYGIYVNRKQQLQQAGIAIATRTTWIEMLGHRNGTQLAFETGTLNAAKSTSQFPGFWEVFEKAAIASGVSAPDHQVLLRALETGSGKHYSVAKGGVVDFSAAMQQVETAYLTTLDPYFNDNLIPSLATGKGEVVLAGGAAALMQSALQRYFEQKGFADRVSFAGGLPERLPAWIADQLPEVQEVSSIPVRMVDCFGLFQALLGEVNRVQGVA